VALADNRAAGVVLRMLHAQGFEPGHLAIGLGPALQPADPALDELLQPDVLSLISLGEL
jgi:hypothetical protein